VQVLQDQYETGAFFLFDFLVLSKRNKMKSKLTCLYFAKIYEDPIELPCGDIICSEHLKQKSVVKQNKINCPKCKQEFFVKGKEFEKNKILQKLLDRQEYLSE
jgi:DNA-directed RNA polymerase subunit RPC12/RpoP